MEKELEKSRRETRDAFKNRGILYRLFFEEFSSEIGKDRTTEIMKRAIYRWGGMKSGRYKELSAKKDFKGVAEEFIKSSVCNGELFKPSIDRVTNKSAIIDMAICPLVEAWKEMNLSNDEIIAMCEIANATDYGKYEGMGFKLTIESTVAKNEDRCRLLVEEKN
ncbi:MAG: L-2-amino-thiazoline-4-carboxylic acid hydrolase [Spirochaetota bacterium]|nr:L-2-amino-thiazoline-4-carboxylic acid hydrolase [Spirochaetota bacterium]